MAFKKRQSKSTSVPWHVELISLHIIYIPPHTSPYILVKKYFKVIASKML